MNKTIFRFSLLFLAIILSFPAWSQLSQSVRGQLISKASGQFVAGALVVLSNPEMRYTSLSDEAGKFELQEVKPGHYMLSVQHINYAPYLEPELVVESSKSVYRRILLQENIRALEEVEIAAAIPPPSLNRREFTVAQTQRYPATFFDPARLVLSQPGVTQANDQANHVVVHGLSPAGIQWRLEGLPIVNPNHLGNAGTRRDRASVSGGGVNMLSGQLMANSAFLSGAMPPRYGNAINGVFDISLRPGNLQEREHTLQAGLLGIDLATEGPISKGNSAYLINYRYSTVGLLSQMGVDFGGEEIQFQDLSAHVFLEDSPLGQLSFFMVGGTNSNRRSPLEDESEWEQDKDRLKIDYTASMGAIGLRQAIALGQQYHWQNGLAFSALENDRLEIWPLTNTHPLPRINRLEDRHKAQQLSAYSRLQRSFSRKLNTELGLQFISHRGSVFADPFLNENSRLDKSLDYTLTQPYLQLTYFLPSDVEVEAGLRFSHFSWKKNSSQLEPYGQLRWHPSNKQTLQLSYGHQSQVYTDHQLLLSSGQRGVISSQYTGLGWGYKIRPHLTLTTEAFYHKQSGLPGTENDLAWNYLSERYLLWTATVNATTYGLDLNLNRSFLEGWYYQLSGSVFEATYRGSDGIERPSPFNNQWSGSFTGGKEWTKEKEKGQRSWGLNLRVHSRGGYRYTPIDPVLSRQAGEETEDESLLYSKQFPIYYTADLRASHTRQKKGYTRIWSLDIQNMLNRRNIGWYYYDFLNEEVRAQEQLGIIPVLAYRIQF